MRSLDDCPLIKVQFLNMKNKMEKWVNLSFELTALMHPYGRCCRSFVPTESSNLTIGGLVVSIPWKDRKNPLMEGFQLYFSDRESANVFHRNNFNVDGADMHVYIADQGHYYYNVKIFKEIYLEKQNCKNYRNIGIYNKVGRYIIFSCL